MPGRKPYYYRRAKKITISNENRTSKIAKEVVKKALRNYGETKYVRSVSVNGTAIVEAATNPNSTLMTAIAGGSTVSTRVGNNAVLKQIDIHYYLNFPINVPNSMARMTVFVDRDPVIGAPVSWSAIWDGAAAAGANDFIGTRTFELMPRFRVLRDKWFRPNNAVNNAATTLGESFGKITIRFKKGFKLRYTSATATDVQKPHIYVLFASNNAAGGGQPIIRFESLLHFKDPE